MPKFSTPSKYLKHSDISENEDTILTITKAPQEIIESNGKKDKKFVCYFVEDELTEGKGLVLNKTNGTAICTVVGSDEVTDWTGHKVALWVKPDVEFGGKIGPAIRVRPRKPNAKV